MPEQSKKRKRIELQTESQAIQFMNEVFVPEEPNNNTIYELKSISIAEIFELMKGHTALFENKSVLSFSRWCSNNRLLFLIGKEERENNIRSRRCYVMEEQYHDDIKSAICQFLPLYQESIKNLKREGFEVVGYARKSLSGDNDENRIKLLQKMVDNLQTRSLATKVFVSFSSRASSAFSERDTSDDKSMIQKLSNVNGDTQDMLHYLQSVDHDVCLVSIDFAGLTSRPEELKRLIENNGSVKKIAIDTFALDNKVQIFDTSMLVSDPAPLAKFDCRKKILQRSL